jgi:uncharacterized membrane protein
MGSDHGAGPAGASGSSQRRSTGTAPEVSADGHAARWSDPSRAMAFSDAVFAIIITLLVLDLVPPDWPPGRLLARLMDRGLMWSNLAVLFATGLLPFPTAVLAQALGAGNLADERIAVGLYGAIGALTTLSWLLFFQYMSRHPALLVDAT